MSLDTLSNVKTRLGITTSADDALLALLQLTAEVAIAKYCDRDFEGGTFTEYHSGGSAFVHLRNYPIEAITSVKVDSVRGFGPESLIDPSSYVVHEDCGVIQSVTGLFKPPSRAGLVNSDVVFWTSGPRIVQVIYSTPVDQVPADIKAAYAQLIGQAYRRVKTDQANNFQNIEKSQLGDMSLQYVLVADLWPKVARELLTPYRVPTA